MGDSQPEVIVIGAGAAGIIAAWRAASLGAKVLLLEKTSRIGTKILISGGGKCNITHDGPLEDLLRAFRPNEARFIRPACYRFTNGQVVDMLTSRGLEVYTRPDGRIFPVNQTAKDVANILGQYLIESGVDLRLDCAVAGIEWSDSQRLFTIKSSTETFQTAQVIVTVGGSSYPASGTTGDGWPWARTMGHTVIKVRAALAPMYMHLVVEKWDKAGVPLRDIVLKARLGGKEIARWTGDLLFTHHGVSGPTVLGISREVAEKIGEGDVYLEIDLRPNESFEDVTESVIAEGQLNPRKRVANFVDQHLPNRLVPDVMEAANIELELPFNKLERKARNRLVNALKGWVIGRVRVVPLEKGEVVAGGIALDEVNPQTMESRLIPGLFFAGEVLDIAGPVGGYNLQAAFATGYVAGETAANVD